MLNWLRSDPWAFLQFMLYRTPAVLLAISLHELAHGYAALKSGDPTARNMGRLSLNPLRPIREACVLGCYDYAHPVFDLAAIRAQQAMPALQGVGGIYYSGAWMGYGFHEDGLKAGMAAAAQLLDDVETAPVAQRVAA